MKESLSRGRVLKRVVRSVKHGVRAAEGGGGGRAAEEAGKGERQNERRINIQT